MAEITECRTPVVGNQATGRVFVAYETSPGELNSPADAREVPFVGAPDPQRTETLTNAGKMTGRGYSSQQMFGTNSVSMALGMRLDAGNCGLPLQAFFGTPANDVAVVEVADAVLATVGPVSTITTTAGDLIAYQPGDFVAISGASSGSFVMMEVLERLPGDLTGAELKTLRFSSVYTPLPDETAAVKIWKPQNYHIGTCDHSLQVEVANGKESRLVTNWRPDQVTISGDPRGESVVNCSFSGPAQSFQSTTTGGAPRYMTGTVTPIDDAPAFATRRTSTGQQGSVNGVESMWFAGSKYAAGLGVGQLLLQAWSLSYQVPMVPLSGVGTSTDVAGMVRGNATEPATFDFQVQASDEAYALSVDKFLAGELIDFGIVLCDGANKAVISGYGYLTSGVSSDDNGASVINFKLSALAEPAYDDRPAVRVVIAPDIFNTLA